MSPNFVTPEFRIRANREGQDREVKVRLVGGQVQKYLSNPATEEDVHEPWPFGGVEAVGGFPTFMRVPSSWVTRAQNEGWLSVEGARPVHRPGGPAEDPWRVTHTFIHVDSITVHGVDGDVTYEPYGKRGQPDKYHESGNPVESSGDPSHTVEWFYDLKKVTDV